MNLSMLSNHVLEFKCWLQICTKKAWITTFLSAKRHQLLGNFVPQTPTVFYISAKLNHFQTSNILISIFSWMCAIEHGLEPCLLSFISNGCLKYAPKWMVSSLIFQKICGEKLTEPPPQTPPPFILGLCRFAVGLGFALDPRTLRALDSGFALNFPLENLGPPPPINSWIRPCFSGIIRICLRNRQFNCTTLSWCSHHEIESVALYTLHYI